MTLCSGLAPQEPHTLKTLATVSSVQTHGNAGCPHTQPEPEMTQNDINNLKHHHWGNTTRGPSKFSQDIFKTPAR